MTYPKPGEIVLTDPTTGDVFTETHDHVDAHEHYVTVEKHQDGVGCVVEYRDKYPWHRVVAVRHDYEDAEDGGRKFAHPEETNE